MINRLTQVLTRMDSRLMPVIAVLLILFLAAEGWLLVLRKPLAEYHQLSLQREALEASLSTRAAPSAELEQLGRELKVASERLNGELLLASSGDRVVASLMETLDHSARKYGLKLSSVKPMEQREVSGFDEVPFDVSVTGAYLPLCEWMLSLGQSLGGNVSISDFEMRALEATGKVALTLKLALYLPPTRKVAP